jgi:nitrite reductase/ring-hydroxylating ferredoxin subunit
MPAEHFVADAGDIPEGTCRIVEVQGRNLGVFNVQGQFYALPNVCFHQGGPLCEGKITGTLVSSLETGWTPEWVLEGQIVRCPWHSMEFDITSGQCLAFPGRRLRTYPVKVEAGRIVVVV